WLVIPQLGRPDIRTMLDQFDMLSIARVGNTDPSLQGQHADTLLFVEGVVMAQVVLKRWGDILWRLIQPLVAFLGPSIFTGLCVLLDLGPETLVGGSHLTGNRTGHLSGQFEVGTDLV